jgi:Putative zinc dependent peptidase (DUF5700)
MVTQRMKTSFFAFIGAVAASLSLATAASAAESQSAPHVELRFDYGGARALIDTLERKALPPDALARLYSVHGATAMIDNVARFLPNMTREVFERDLKTFVETREEMRHEGYRVWGFQNVWETRNQIEGLISKLEVNEADIVRGVQAELKPYQPDTGPLAITVYFVAGGVSDGFVPDRGAPAALYVNLARAQGDLTGVVSNLTHETYHVMQQTASRRVPELIATVDEPEKLLPADRLLAVTLWEGTANYAADPRRSRGTGPYLEMWRSRYERNTTLARLTENFAMFDAVLDDLRAQRISWDDAYRKGFTGTESRFYFVGYEMARVIEEHCGRSCIGRLFQRPPVEFFRLYIALYRAHPEVRHRFSTSSEKWLAAFGD